VIRESRTQRVDHQPVAARDRSGNRYVAAPVMVGLLSAGLANRRPGQRAALGVKALRLRTQDGRRIDTC